MTKIYWKFNYEPGLSYPPNWYGEGRFPIPYEKVTVLLQNDKDGFGIAYCEEKDFGKFQGNIQIITEAESSRLLNKTISEQDTVAVGMFYSDEHPEGVPSNTIQVPKEGVYYGAKLRTRWDAPVEEVKPIYDIDKAISEVLNDQ